MSEEVMQVSIPICPSCGGSQVIPLERIDVEVQHRNYAPADCSAQEKLTSTLRELTECYQMARCVSCTLEYTWPLIAPNSEWYSLAYNLLDLYPSERWEFNPVLNSLQAKCSLGEIGCGNGEFLSRCRSAGIDSHGIDFSVDAVEACLSKQLSASVMDIQNPSFRPEEKKNAIVAFHVLEHLDDPGALFRLASLWAAEQSTLWVAVPSDLRPSRVFGEVDFLDQPPHHMTRWTPQALKTIGIEHGWHLNETVHEPMSMPAVLWSYSTRNNIYKHFMSSQFKSSRWMERAIRWGLYPSALARQFRNKGAISGFCLLASYSQQKND